MITQFGINMLVPILLCTFLGIFLDRKLGTSFLVIILFFMGALAGFRNIYFFAKKIYSQESKRDRIRNQHKDDLGKNKKD
ncbi:MAG: AtpZ/AtpI family protein [Lachnospiraceae bacterium]|nr:AtpZ/AtpI family protein [Lachnospiraceae bacterium]